VGWVSERAEVVAGLKVNPERALSTKKQIKHEISKLNPIPRRSYPCLRRNGALSWLR
jgi:hypothetical protein